jgi:hypothetical protein
MSYGDNQQKDPIVWRMLEGLLINVLIVIAVVMALVSYVWDCFKHIGRGGR